MEGLCCIDHGPDCEENHPQISLELWLSGKGLCGECGVRKGTRKWGESVQVARGHFTLRCEICALEAQLKHARERSEVISKLERELKEADKEDLSELLVNCYNYISGSGTDSHVGEKAILEWLELRME